MLRGAVRLTLSRDALAPSRDRTSKKKAESSKCKEEADGVPTTVT